MLIVLVAIVSLRDGAALHRATWARRATGCRLLNADLEDAVAERTADLTRANEEIQRFAYIVSHDLRSPLVNVMGFTAELDAARATLAELVDRADAARARHRHRRGAAGGEARICPRRSASSAARRRRWTG